jgi:outer membrane murein-binding lipoprotein Lpp
MSPRFIAEPPLPVERQSLSKHLRLMLLRLWFILWQIFVPFKGQPEPVDDVPEPSSEIAEEQVKQCQWIFDQAAARRVVLEQKAQSTFGLMLFLVPLLASLFVFVISKSPASHPALRVFGIGLLAISGILLFLGFTAAVRAISVKTLETLFVHSVIDETGKFREYKKAFHARGLLYCAAMNEAMNDHIAQFVKGTHILTAAAVIALVVAAIPTSYVLSGLPSSPTETKIVGPVDVSSTEFSDIRADVANLKVDIEKLEASSRAANDGLKVVGEKVSQIDAKISKLQRAAPSGPARKGTTPPPR